MFTDIRVKRENLYPILVVQLDSENFQSAIALEEEYCQYLDQKYPATFNNSRCNPRIMTGKPTEVSDCLQMVEESQALLLADT